MTDQEQLLDWTESYLTSLIAQVSGVAAAELDGQAPFGELGIDSFRVLKILKALEADFGQLPKTLLFEHFNIKALAVFFVERHAPTLAAKFVPTNANAQLPKPKQAKREQAVATNESALTRPAIERSTHDVLQAPGASCAIRVLEQDLPKYPGLHTVMRQIFDRYVNEGGASRGTRVIAPNLFIGRERRGYFHYGRSKDLVLAYAYTGPSDYFAELAREMQQYCAERRFQLNLLTDEPVESIGEVAFSATPFGALQRILNLQDFSLLGAPMRRLRYQVSKFEKAGRCRTEEYRCGTRPDVDQGIATLIDQWCAARTMVNPLIHEVRQEIVAGSLAERHRLFLTYVDDELRNAILLTAMSSEHPGYLMDLEFYTPQMPQGGLEFAIVSIIEKLATEGCTRLSLGGTYGCRVSTSPTADTGIEKILDELHQQGIFNDAGNLQFKNKFRPDTRSIHLCRPQGSGSPDTVIDLILMIADPLKARTSEAENHNVPEALSTHTQAQKIPHTTSRATSVAVVGGNAERAQHLADSGFNPLNLSPEQVAIDLKTDSWAQLRNAAIERQMAHLRGQLQQSVNLHESLQAIFPFRHFVLTTAGRTAEQLLYKALPKKGVVLENLLFPTGIYHQIDQGFTPRELPHPQVFRLDSTELYKGNLDLTALQEQLAREPGAIACVCIEVCDNATGGGAVSLQHLQDVKTLLAPHSIPLILDATRILENARYVIENEPSHAGKTIWAVARELLACADVVVASLAKDFCIDKGGLICSNDELLMRKLQELLEQEGGGLNVIDKKLIGLGLQNRKHIEGQVLRRMEAVRSIWQALQARDVPVSAPVGGHCVLIDIKRLPEFQGLKKPVASFLAWMYLNAGIRAGAHSVGMQQARVLQDQVRLAIPLGMPPEQVANLIDRLVALFREPKNIPELELEGPAIASLGDVHSRYRVLRYHRVAETVAETSQQQATPQPAGIELPNASTQPYTGPEAAAAPPSAPPAQPMDIAIVGMAGRYPKARTLHALWTNLRQGRDCIGELPPERLAQRAQGAFAQNYRGGFLEDVDRFDSLFFNISPREAEALDPQERLFLETAWEAIEDAGYYPEMITAEGGPRDVGVFVGAVWAMYQLVGVEAKLAGVPVHPNSFLWSIANRVSYWMNLTGPSLTVDTACSSSLTALYLACEAIQKGDCSAALVGGVNLDLHQHKFDINSAGGALSRDGVCRSFGAGANGYVAGEGVGAILLKPLERALADQDHIYGVIKGVVTNHGGRTSGYTVPSPKAQAKLIQAALAKARIDARTIGYIEAHGTGTELGDPIEIAGLTSAFSAFDVAKQTCAIGSVKTNIGHLEAAAGIVGLCKVLLQIQHRQIAPSLHSAELNPLMDISGSPFYVPQQLEPWTEKVLDGIKYPLRAGISSFGAGGANAHVIVEHYARPATEESVPAGGHVVPLSARNDEQLRAMAQRLCSFLEQEPAEHGAAHTLGDIAFTLQNGRKSFDHRLAIVASTRDELIAKLRLPLESKADPDIFTGHVKNSEAVNRLLNRGQKEQFAALLAQSSDSRKLAQLWTEGLLPDWRFFRDWRGSRRVPLPTYPFADKRYWVRPEARRSSVPALQTLPGMYPLIDSNESTFRRQLFKKRFHGGEFVLRDHVVAAVPTLPGTAYLDLARKAGEIAAGRKVRKIKNVIWMNPLRIQGAAPTEVFIELKPAGDAVLFEVFSESGDGAKTIYSQGKLAYDARETATEPEYLDIEAIRARCTRAAEGREAYALFKSVGLNYGPSFRAVQEVFRNDDEILGLLRLPEVCNAYFQDFVLHPSLLDAAMQAGVVAQLGANTGEMKIPYSMGEVEILHPLTRSCYSYVTKANGGKSAGSKLSRENVTIVDESGRVLVRIRESVGVPLVNATGGHDLERAVSQESFTKLHYVHAWQQSAPLSAPHARGPVLLFDTDERIRDAHRARTADAKGAAAPLVLVLPGDAFADLGQHTYRINPNDRNDYGRLFACLSRDGCAVEEVCYAWSDCSEADRPDSARAALDKGVHSFLLLCQSLIERKSAARSRLLYLYFGAEQSPQPHNEAMNGFIRSLRLENPRIDAKVLELQHERADHGATLSTVLAELDPAAQDAMTVRHASGVRHVRTLRTLDLNSHSQQNIALKESGVYLITGGAGGLGLIFADFLAKQCKARLVLTGRSELSAGPRAQLDALQEHGAQVHYIAADVSNREDVRCVIEETRTRFGGIDGIIHGAGVLRDSYLRNKTREEMEAVFAPKIFGSLHLDELTRNESLDFFVLFSSLAAIGGNAGQCDYAFANHYMDSFAARREQWRAAGLRSGRTISFNWSLWADGGMKLDEQTESFFKKNLGIQPLRTSVGLESFIGGLSSDSPHIAVLEGVRDKIEQAWGLKPKSAPAMPAAAESRPGVTNPASTDLGGAVVQELSKLVTELLKLDANDLSVDSILLDLGFDSIGLSAFANAINRKYGLDINPVLFFEHPSIKAVAQHLSTEHAAAVRSVHGGKPSEAQTHAKAAPHAAETSAETSARESEANAFGEKWNFEVLEQASPGFSRELRFVNEPIAIVGIAGVMPQSDTLEEFWNHLKDARDLVTEIPRDRWMWEDYHGDPVKQVNKSNSKWGGFMKEVDKFDPLFFGIVPREAEMMDPQQRIFLETVYHAIEDSGHKVSDLSGTKTGLFVGVSAKDYVDVLSDQQLALDGYSAAGNSHSILANRVSFLLNLRGPSAPIDTACSSSLIALHRAIESIHTGSCEMAIVGGVQTILTPIGHVSLSSAGMLSTDGRCKTFDKDANGYVRGEGAGAIFIKPLSKALADGNPIYAVIKSTAENHGGRVTVLTAPNANAQAELLIEAYQKAHVDPATVGYIECHGTGTSLGDPIEIQALKKAFSELYKKHDRPPPAAPHCGLSSVKTNIGHLEPAAGIASLLKALLAMKHRQIPALIHFQELNPYIDLNGSPFYIVNQTRPWETVMSADGTPLPRRAGVSSFGWGGANAHIVLEEYIPPERPESPTDEPQIVVLSAKSEDRLKACVESLLAHIQKAPGEKSGVELADLAYTLQVGRDAFEERLGVIVSSLDELTEKLRAFIAGDTTIQSLYRARVSRGSRKETHAVQSGNSLLELAHAWARGAEVDWTPLHEGRSRVRISLPGYPFARERYWVDTASSKKAAKPAASVESIMAVPKWEAQARARASRSIPYPRHEVVLCNLPRVDVELVGTHAWRAHFNAEANIAKRYQTTASDVLERLQAILRSKPREKVLFQVAIGQEGEGALLAGLSGMIRTARLENSNLIGQVILTSNAVDSETLAEQLRAAQAEPAETMLKYEQSTRYVMRWQVESPQGAPTIAFEDRGVYLITGGLGGLGRLFAKDILRQAPGARVVLTGRSDLTPDKQVTLNRMCEELAVPARQLIYRPLDLDRLADVTSLVEEVVKTFGGLNGVIHSAGTTRDSLILNKSAADLAHVLGPKVNGAVNLDLATQNCDLDFLVLFSSLAGALGNAGQADYAAANGFMDQLAHHRNRLVNAGQRRGQTLSINWSLWEQGGMQLDASRRALLLKSTGIAPLKTQTGLQAFHRALQLKGGQILIMEGHVERLRQLLAQGEPAEPAPKATRAIEGAADPQAGRLRQLILAELRSVDPQAHTPDVAGADVLNRLVGIIESTLKFPPGKVDVDAEFANLGISSLIVMELIETLDRSFAVTLTPALFSEAETLRELASLLERLKQETAGSSLSDVVSAVKRKYAIDLSQRGCKSPEEIVDVLLSDYSGEMQRHYGTGLRGTGLPTAQAQSPSDDAPAQALDIAIVGLSCRLPDAPDARAFWKNLLEEKNSVRELPKSRWNWEDYFSAAPAPEKTVSKWGALLEHVDGFDAEFFDIRPQEAQVMDPQQRLLLQETYRAIEDAGKNIRSLAGSNTGVFVGYQYSEYEQHLRRLDNKSMRDGPVFSSSSPTYYLANRLSFAFDFRGPSESFNVNCASSAVAVNRAYYSLVNGETDLAVAGGVSLNLFAHDYVASSQYGLLSPDGTSGVFDDNAKGFSRGEGVAVVVLKRLADAKRDNDRIYAVIKSCHQNYRGAARSLSELRTEPITDVLGECYRKAAVAPETVQYIEVDGYATKWADSLEYEGVKNVFKGEANGKHCALGNVKGNIGNVEAASGVTSVIKLALALRHKTFPATISMKKLNTYLDIERASHPLYIADKTIRFDDIRRDDRPVRAGVNSFADSGTNVHILLEEYRAEAQATEAAAPHGQLFLLSAKNAERLQAYVQAFIDFLSAGGAAGTFAELIYTSQMGREALYERLAIVASSRDELLDKLIRAAKSGMHTPSGLDASDIYRGKIDPAEKHSLANLITADMARMQLVQSIQTRQWRQIALLWVNGVHVPWDVIWQGKTVRPVSLPGYPFAEKRYWIDDLTVTDSADARVSIELAAAAEPGTTTTNELYLYTPADDSAVGADCVAMSRVDKMELFLRQQIARQLKKPAASLPVDEHLSDLGMSSMAIAGLIHKLDRLLGTHLSPGMVFKYPAIRWLAAHLAETHPETIDALVVSHNPPAEVARQAETRALEPADILIPLQTLGTRTPIFAAPGAGGNALSLQQLSHALGNDQPFYCLEPVGLNGAAEAMRSVEAIAQLNIDRLQSVQRTGPYRLLGYSNGGVVAFEMARQLMARDESIAALILLDTLCPTLRGRDAIETMVVAVFRHFVRSLGGVADLTVEQLVQVPESERGEFLYGIVTRLGFELPKQLFLSTVAVATASEQACRAYQPAKLSGRMDATLFRASDGFTDAADYGWGQFLLDPPRIHRIRADHFNLVEKGPVKEVARLIGRTVERSGGKQAAKLAL